MRLKTGIVLFVLSFIAAGAYADGRHSGDKGYRVTITNITKNIAFTPFIAATHTRAVRLFTLGEPSSDALAALAEGGDTGPLEGRLKDSSQVHSIAGSEGRLMPGQSVDIDIRGGGHYGKLSLAAMLLPTNDTFVSLNAVSLPRGYAAKAVYLARAYDAGSEPNDELCANIPGPTCGGEGGSPLAGGEGYVYPSPGTHGEADLSKAEFGWTDPVARVVVRRLH